MALRAASRSLMLAARHCQPAAGSSMHFQHVWQQSDSQTESSKSKPEFKPCFNSFFFRSQWSGPSRDTYLQSNMIELLQSTNVLRLRQDIEDESRTKFHTTYNHLLNLCQTSGAASSREEAEQLSRALVQAGVVLKFGEIVYLRPTEIAEIITYALPGTMEETKRKLESVETELETLTNKYQAIEKEARKWPNLVLFVGWFLLMFQMIGFAWLTFYELSWDVMEPVAYFVSLFYTLMGYGYFLLFRSGYDYHIFEDFWKQRNKSKKYKEYDFDPDKYQHLLKLKYRYRQHLNAMNGTSNPLELPH